MVINWSAAVGDSVCLCWSAVVVGVSVCPCWSAAVCVSVYFFAVEYVFPVN